MADFWKVHSCDEAWDGKPSDAEKEIANMEKRKDDIYPQGREACVKFLKKAAKKGFPFKIRAVKTKPHWTWYFDTECVPYLTGVKLGDFCKQNNCDEAWDGKPDDADKELANMEKRKDDTYPQGRENCAKFLKECKKRGYSFKIQAVKTKPHWTWYFQVVA